MRNIDTYTGRLGNRLFQTFYLYSQVKEGKIPDWYIQTPEYFEKHAEELKQLLGDGIGFLPYVAIHLRRGDYVTTHAHFYVELAKTGYYIDACNLFPGRKFLVFSDDIPFAKTYFEGDKFAFDESTNELDSFNLMASCADFIIANSSFSYAAALLSPTPTKKVVAPTYDKYYTDGNTTRTVLPKEWTQI